jgi:lambda family phage portal protein
MTNRHVRAVNKSRARYRAAYRKNVASRFPGSRSGVQYAAAKTNRLTGPWTATDADVNKLVGASSATIRQRVRQLVRDFPYFARAVRIMTDYVVGTGIVPQPRLKTPDGKLDTSLNQKIEDAWDWFADEADVAGKLHLYEMMQLSKRQDQEAGEFILVKRFRPNESRYIPFCIQIFEADWLSPAPATKIEGSKAVGFDQGIEFDRSTGRVRAYHFTDPDGWGKAARISADQVIHGFETLRPGQLRGVSPFAAAILVAHDLSTVMDAEIDAAKMASKYLGFIKSQQPMGMANSFGREQDPETGEERYVEEMENAILKVLLPGEDIEFADASRPNANIPPFVKLILCMLAVTSGAPYELLSGDYQGLNYSTGKMIRNDFAHSLRPVALREIRHFCMPVFRSFMDHAVMAGKLSFPNYFQNPYPWRRVVWQPPGMEPVDASRETKSNIDQIKTGLRSPQEITAARGRNLEDVYNEIAAAADMAKHLGLSFGNPSTALANNPAAIEKQKSE